MQGLLEKLKSRLRGAPLQAEVRSPKEELAPGGRLASARPELRTRLVYIGLDFGTCNTKAVVQLDPEKPRQQKFLAVEHRATAQPGQHSVNPFLCPSSARVENGDLLFGYLAEVGASLEVAPVRSFKMCLPCQWN